MAQSPDVIVIGGGIVGTSTAWHLAQAGARVKLLEKGQIAGEQSGRNWGFIRRQGRDPAEIGLAARANTLYARLERELGAPVGWVRRGNLRVAEDESKMRQYRDWFVETDAGRSLGTRMIEPAEIQALVPGMAGGWVGGMYTAEDGHADPERVTRAVADAAARVGASIETGTSVVEITARDGRVTGVRTTTGREDAPVVVVAAGIWAARLLRPLRVRLPVRWVRGTVALTRPQPPITELSIWTPSVAFRQRVDGRVVLGMSGASDFDITLDSLQDVRPFLPNYRANWRLFRFHIGRMLLEDIRRRLPPSQQADSFDWPLATDPPPNRSKVRRTLQAFGELFPEIPPPNVDRTWAGYMDATPDGLPAIGSVARLDGLYIAAGFSGHGFGLGPAVGEALSQLIVSGHSSVDLTALRPERFAAGGIAIRPRRVT
jgi:glycine/D-amino acid oxidase-like deaminating enzyme